MRTGLVLSVLCLAGCGATPAAVRQAVPEPRVIVQIADLTDCGGSGTSCPELTSRRRISIGLDGSVRASAGQGVSLQPGRVRVRGQASFDIAVKGFGKEPKLIWSPSRARFAVLEELQSGRQDHVLVVEPARRRWWRLPLARGVREISALTFKTDDRFVAEIVGPHDYIKLAELDATTGRVRRARYLENGFEELAWSPVARRMVGEDVGQRVGVFTIARPNEVSWTTLKGVPRWSPDGTRIMVTHPECCPPYAYRSDGIDTSAPEVAVWPGGASVPVPKWLFSGIWLPEGHTLIALYGHEGNNGPKQLVQLADDGTIARVIEVQWPPRTDPDNEFSLAPDAVPVRIEGLDPLG
ncbi:hypothetical protein [Solirubrobacter soli]|uniref:hypothetical protein n=1 Tax=Solirubrobacter soli TaxID=363832 RepID=UPI0003F64C7B|nr:hypothetical protein [Solirubrobacter soli]